LLVVTQQLRGALRAANFSGIGSEAYTVPFRVAVASVTGVRPAQVNITGVDDLISSRRRLAAGEIIGVTIDYELEVVVQELQDDGEDLTFADIQAEIVAKITTATISESENAPSPFAQALVAAANGGTEFDSVVVSDAEVDVVALLQPTSMPTVAPTPFFDEDLFYIILPVSGFVFLCLVIFIIRYVRKRNKKAAFYREAHAKRAAAEADGSAFRVVTEPTTFMLGDMESASPVASPSHPKQSRRLSAASLNLSTLKSSSPRVRQAVSLGGHGGESPTEIGRRARERWAATSAADSPTSTGGRARRPLRPNRQPGAPVARPLDDGRAMFDSPAALPTRTASGTSRSPQGRSRRSKEEGESYHAAKSGDLYESRDRDEGRI
jgi:hypothetical protein